MHKRSLPASLTALGLLAATSAGAQGISVLVNGQPVSFTGAQPAQIQGRTLVPLRGVLEQMGATLVWDPATRTVIGSKGERRFELPIGSRTALMNGRSMPLDVPAQIFRGTTMVPLRFVSEALGADVRWSGSTQTVEISTDELTADIDPADDDALRGDDFRDRGGLRGRDRGRRRDDDLNRRDNVRRRDGARRRDDTQDRDDSRRDRPRRRIDLDDEENLRDRDDDRLNRSGAADLPGTSALPGGLNGTSPIQTTTPAAGDPVIQSFSHSGNGPLRAGSAVEFTMEGTPGARAAFDVIGVASNVAMSEVSPGRYVGRLTVPAGLNVENARAFGRLVAGNRQAPIIQAGTPIRVDAQPPQIVNLSPAQGTVVTQARPDIYAEYRAEGVSGIDTNSVQVIVNGKDVTSQARVTPGFVFYTPPADLNGPVSVQIRVADRAGNGQNATTSFNVRPAATGILSVTHNADEPLRPGDALTVTMKAEPGGVAAFDITGVTDPAQGVRMTETAPGTYTASYTVKPNDKVFNVPVKVRFISKGAKIHRMNAAQPVSLAGGQLQAPTILEPKPNERLTGVVTVVGRAEPGATVRVSLNTSGRLFGLLPIEGSNIVQEVQAGADGTFKTDPLPLPSPVGAKDLRYQVQAVTTDPLGRTSTPTAMTFQAR